MGGWADGSDVAVTSRLQLGAGSPGFKIPRTSPVLHRSARKGAISPSSVSWTSLNHDDTGTALWGWKMYDAGELSMMIVLPTGLPSCERSWGERLSMTSREGDRVRRSTNLYVVPSMVITALSEKSMRYAMIWI